MLTGVGESNFQFEIDNISTKSIESHPFWLLKALDRNVHVDISSFLVDPHGIIRLT